MQTWIFSDFSIPKDLEAYVAALRQVRASDVVFGLTRETSAEFRLIHAESRYVEAAAALAQAGIRVHLMTWLRPDGAFIDKCVERLLALVDRCRATSVLLDVEGFWTKGTGHAEAADRFYARFGTPRPVPVGVTSYTELPSSVKPLLADADYGLPQAYSIWDEERDWTMRELYQPGSMQRRAYAKWSPVNPNIVMGLAAYKQNRPAMSQGEAMERAIAASRDLGVDALAWWSYAWLVGSNADAERAAVVAAVRGDTPPAPAPVGYLEAPGSLRRGDLDVTWTAEHGGTPTVPGRQVTELQQDLARIGRELGEPDGNFGKKTEEAVRALQQAARTPFRATGNGVVEVPVTFADAATGVVDAATKSELALWLEAGYVIAVDSPSVPERPAGTSPTSAALEYAGRVLAAAAGQVGVREVPRDSNRGPMVETFQKTVGAAPGTDWCYAFAFWCHLEAASSMEATTSMPTAYGGSVRGFRDARRKNVETYLPEDVLAGTESVRAGDVGILVRKPTHRDSARAGNLHSGHTFLVTGEREGAVIGTIEGNTNPGGSADGGGVYVRTRQLDDPALVGFIRPSPIPK